MNRQSGLTLLELIIVVIIVGALAALALPRVSTMIDTSKAVEGINALQLTHRAIQKNKTERF